MAEKLKEKLKVFFIAFKKLVISIIENDFYGMAAEMGFMAVIGIFPFMLFLTAVFGWMGNKALMDPILIFLSRFMPDQAIELIITVLSEAMIFSHGRLMAVVGICVTLVLSTNAMAVVLKGLNRAYKVEETRNFVYTRALALLMVFVDTMVLFLTINLIIFGKVIINFLITFPYVKSCSDNIIDATLAGCICSVISDGIFKLLYPARFARQRKIQTK